MDTKVKERQLIDKILNSELLDGRPVRALITNREPGSEHLNEVMLMLTRIPPDIAKAGRLISNAARDYAKSQREDPEEAWVHNVMSQLDQLRYDLEESNPNRQHQPVQ